MDELISIVLGFRVVSIATVVGVCNVKVQIGGEGGGAKAGSEQHAEPVELQNPNFPLNLHLFLLNSPPRQRCVSLLTNRQLCLAQFVLPCK